jgi:hypothetical protein
MSLSANFPTTRPSLLLDFVNSGQMDPRITFSRASGATWFNSAGTLIGVDASSSSLTVGTGQQTLTLAATAGVDRGWIVGTSVLLSASTVTNTMTGVVVSYTASTQVLVVNVASVVGSGTYATWQVSNLMPRFDYNPSTLAAQGLLIEESRTNSLTRSEEFNDAAWTKANSSITANAATAPSGTVTADKLIEALDVNLVHQTTQSGVTIVSLGTYTASCYVKADTRTRVRIGFLVGGASGVTADANLAAGTIAAASAFGGGSAVGSSIQAINNGWYRITVSGTGAAGTSGECRIELLDASGNRQYNGDGTSGLFLWGAQLEAGAFPTSYIPTTTTALTRAADVASVNTLSPWYNATTGTIYAEGVSANFANFPFFVQFHDSTANNTIATMYRNTGAARIEGTVGGVAWTPVNTANTITAGTVGKAAFAWTASDQAAVLNAGTAATGTNTTIPAVTVMQIGGSRTQADMFNGYLRRIVYYPRRLSNAELQSITS